MADFGRDFCWEWELLLGVVKGHVKQHMKMYYEFSKFYHQIARGSAEGCTDCPKQSEPGAGACSPLKSSDV